MIEPVWVQTLGALATGLASIAIGFYTWRLWRLEHDRDLSDIIPQWTSTGSQNVTVRLFNSGKQADSVTSVVVEEICPDYDGTKKWKVDEFRLEPLGQANPISQIKPGAVVELKFRTPSEVELRQECSSRVEIGFAIDEGSSLGIARDQRMYV